MVRALGRRQRQVQEPTEEDRRRTLALLGVAPTMFDALSSLDEPDRVVLVAGWIEGLDPRDLEGVLRCRPATRARMLARARGQFLDAYLRTSADVPPILHNPGALGPLAQRIRTVAQQTMGRAGSPA